MWRGSKLSRIRWRVIPLILAPALILTACGGKKEEKAEVLLYEEGGASAASGAAVSGSAAGVKEDEFQTTVVEKTTYKEEFSDAADIEYTDTDALYIFEENAVLDAVKVKQDQEVKKGDVVAVYHVETSKTKLQKQKLLVDQARAEYESGLSQLNQSLSDAKKELGGLKSKTERKLKGLEIKKIQKQIAAYKKNEKEVISQEKEYAKLVRMQKKTNLVAKKSGVVTATALSEVGEEIDSSLKIVEMRSNDEWMLKVSDPESKLRYNMEVSVRLGKGVKDYDEEVKGKVITASDITGGGDDESYGENDADSDSPVYIEVSDADKKKYDFENQNIFVYAVSFAVEDVLVVDAEAVYSESVDISNKLYVLVVENGKLHKRYIVSNYKTDKKVLVDQGVFEGQTLAILAGDYSN